jgi:hypothetical protein
LDPQQAAAQLTLATALIESKDYEAAIKRLTGLLQRGRLTPTNLSIAQGLMGDALDRLDRPAEAFAAYAASQATQRAANKSVFEKDGTESSAELVARLIGYFRDADADAWRVPRSTIAEPDVVKTHVFLVGFPRSGTTLLEQILAGHPNIDAMAERNCLIDAQKSFTVPLDGLDKLALLGHDDLSAYRDAYWSRVRQEGFSLKRDVFVDKMPLYSITLFLIAKMFPRAKILFAIRDPRDVLLGSFRRRFGMTQQMYELTSLDTAAEYYDHVMQLSELYRDKLGLEICDVRHEDLVADATKCGRRICDFLQVPWNDAMLAFAQAVGSRSVNTPSGPQLARGLTSQGIGQWRRYRAQIEPVMPKLAPWIAHFGYSAD